MRSQIYPLQTLAFFSTCCLELYAPCWPGCRHHLEWQLVPAFTPDSSYDLHKPSTDRHLEPSTAWHWNLCTEVPYGIKRWVNSTRLITAHSLVKHRTQAPPVTSPTSFAHSCIDVLFLPSLSLFLSLFALNEAWEFQRIPFPREPL